jgi:hypothetical protein
MPRTQKSDLHIPVTLGGVTGLFGLLLTGISAFFLFVAEGYEWWSSSMNSLAQDYYLNLVSGVMSALNYEVLVVGVFLVLLTRAGGLILGTGMDEMAKFVKTLLLLFFVILFSSYYALAFELESQVTEMPKGAERPWLPIWMVLLDLISISLNAGLMVSLADDRVLADLVGHEGSGTEHRSILDKLKVLLGLSATWHFFTVLWWVVFWGLGTDAHPAPILDMAYHGLFSGLHLLGIPLVIALCQGRRGHPVEWAGIGYYCFLLGACYLTRMYSYICRDMDCAAEEVAVMATMPPW